MIFKGPEVWAGFMNDLLELRVSSSFSLDKCFMVLAKGCRVKSGAELSNSSKDFNQGVAIGEWGERAKLSLAVTKQLVDLELQFG
jgi:hypothetical protein